MRFKVKNALKEIIIMNTNKKLLLIITFLLIMCTGISISYAFFKVLVLIIMQILMLQ